MLGISEKDNVFRVRQENSEGFNKLITFSLDTGIQAIEGVKDDGSKVIQSLIFAKKNFNTQDKVKSWIDSHKDYHYNELNEMAMSVCYTEFENTEFLELYDIPTEELQELKDDGWLFICREFDLDGRGKVTKQDLIEMKENYENNVRGIKLDIDWDHKKRRDDAAGWYGEMMMKKITLHDGREVWALFTKAEWGDEAQKSIDSKAYRYFSPEIAFKYYDNEKKKWYKNVLFGGAILNRPEIKGQPEIGMVASEKIKTNQEEVSMKLTEIFKNHSIEYAENGDIEKAVQSLSDMVGTLGKDIETKDENIKKLTESIKTLSDDKVDIEKTKIELKEQVVKLEEVEKKRLETVKEDRIEALCEKAIKDEKIEPAEADFKKEKGSFYELAVGNVEAAEKFLETLVKKTLKPDGTPIADNKESVDPLYDETMKLAEKIAEQKKISVETAFIEASVEISEKHKGGNE